VTLLAPGLARLRNEHIFHETDFVVYCEGGGTIAIHDAIEKRRGDPKTSDAKFWSSVLGVLFPKSTFHVKSVGNRPNVRHVANLLVENDEMLPHVVAAMDRDMSRRAGDRIKFPRVLYTFGYSWENDVWTITALDRLAILAGVEKEALSKHIAPHVEALKTNLGTLEPLVKLDLILALYDRVAYERDRAMNCISKGDGVPAIDEQFVSEKIESAKRAVENLSAEDPKELEGTWTVHSDFQGHVIHTMFGRTFRCLLGACGISKNVGGRDLDSLLFQHFCERLLGETSPVTKHYLDSCRGIDGGLIRQAASGHESS
jgi:hypothetical protein